jgi:hypothetical protein
MHGILIDHNPAVADADKAAEIDDCGTDLPAAVDQKVDEPPHVLARNATDLLAQDPLDLLILEHRGCGSRLNRSARRLLQ